MIISRTPYRISFFGGGTDYPAWYLKHGGQVIATTINKYCYITCRYLPPFFEHRIRIVYSRSEICQTIDEISHPAVREILRFLNVEHGVEIHHDGDLPARSGVGSSSSFTVGMLHACHALKGYMPTRKQLSAEAIKIEQETLKETVGSQDQVMAAYGGFNHVSFGRDGSIGVRPVTVLPSRLEELNSHLMLLFTGFVRTASTVATSWVEDVEKLAPQYRVMSQMVDEAVTLLSGRRDIAEFGRLLNEGWKAKRSLSSGISNSVIDDAYLAALGAGAVGGKLVGAGGGGFMLLFAPPERQKAVRERLHDFLHVPFKFDTDGSQIVFYDPEEDYSDLHVQRAGRQVPAFKEADIRR